MSDLSENQGEVLFQKIVHATVLLENCVAEQDWRGAVRAERERYALLQQLSSDESLTRSPRYREFLRQALASIQAKQPEIEVELQRSRQNLSELGQQRMATDKYRDVFST